MNKERRNQIQQAIDLINEAKGIFDLVMAEEQEAFDNLPEGLQGADKGQAMETAIAALEDASGGCDAVIDSCNEAME